MTTGTRAATGIARRGSSEGAALVFVEWCARSIGVRREDRLSNHAPLHFDLSVFDVYLAALGRATLVLVPGVEAFFGSEAFAWGFSSGPPKPRVRLFSHFVVAAWNGLWFYLIYRLAP